MFVMVTPSGVPFGGLRSFQFLFAGFGIFDRDMLAGLLLLLRFRCPGIPKGRLVSAR